LHLVFLVNPLVNGSLIPGDRIGRGSVHPRGAAAAWSAALLDDQHDRRGKGRQAEIREPHTQIEPISHLTILCFLAVQRALPPGGEKMRSMASSPARLRIWIVVFAAGLIAAIVMFLVYGRWQGRRLGRDVPDGL